MNRVMPTLTHPHELSTPSLWVRRWAHLIRPAGTVLDVACGHGRHLRWLAARGYRVTGVDHNRAAIAALAPLGQALCADLENDPWPFEGACFDGVIVTHYLWRALFPSLIASVAPGGILLYETFAHGQQTLGRPRRPDFLLQPGELLQHCASLRVVAYEDGFCTSPDRFIQRIAALRPDTAAGSSPTRSRLDAPVTA